MAKLTNTLVKCSLINVDEHVTIQALFNPKEISIDKSVPWQKHKSSRGDNPLMEFTGAQPAKLSVELFFDTYEDDDKNVYDRYIKKLEELTKVKSDEADEDKRPPMCIFEWGTKFPKFKGVVESLSVKYTMFLPDGTPCRATAAIKMTQASRAKAKKRKKKSSAPEDELE